MSYTSRYPLDGVDTVVSAAKAVVEDPCLAKVSGLVLRLNALEQAPAPPAPRPGPPGTTPPRPPPKPPTKGIGLCHAVKPLEIVVWARERPWVVPVGGLALVGGLIGLGYLLGSRRRR